MGPHLSADTSPVQCTLVKVTISRCNCCFWPQKTKVKSMSSCVSIIFLAQTKRFKMKIITFQKTFIFIFCLMFQETKDPKLPTWIPMKPLVGKIPNRLCDIPNHNFLYPVASQWRHIASQRRQCFWSCFWRRPSLRCQLDLILCRLF